MNYDPRPTTSVQAAMAMTLANAGKSQDCRQSHEKRPKTPPSLGLNELQKSPEKPASPGLNDFEKTPERPSTPGENDCRQNKDEPKGKKLKLVDEDEGPSPIALTQGINSNPADGHTLFFLREQQLAAERQRLFLSKKK